MALRSVLSQEHRQRAARRVDRLRQRLEFRLPVEPRLAQRPQHVRGLRRLRDHHAGQHDRLVHVQRPELAQGADLQHRGHADLEPGRAHDHGGRQPADLERLVLGPDDGPRDHARVQHRLRSGGRHVQHHQLPGRVERAAGRRARHLRRADRPRRRPSTSKAVLQRRHGQVRGARRRARSRAATRSSACSRRIRGG